MKNQLKQWASTALDTILPPRCIISEEPVDRQGMIAPRAWAGLDFITNPICRRCGHPFGFETEEETHCTACLSDPPPFTSARAALKYNDTSKQMILGFKHADKTFAVRAFLPWLRASGAEMLSAADYLIPVPLHHWRLVMRRYNQAAIIAHALTKQTGIPTLPAALRRTRATPPQGYLSARDRAKNVRKAFALHPKDKAKIEGKTIILIDDVMTTGSTIKECTKVLKQAGARDVHALTVARSCFEN